MLPHSSISVFSVRAGSPAAKGREAKERGQDKLPMNVLAGGGTVGQPPVEGGFIFGGWGWGPVRCAARARLLLSQTCIRKQGSWARMSDGGLR